VPSAAEYGSKGDSRAFFREDAVARQQISTYVREPCERGCTAPCAHNSNSGKLPRVPGLPGLPGLPGRHIHMKEPLLDLTIDKLPAEVEVNDNNSDSDGEGDDDRKRGVFFF